MGRRMKTAKYLKTTNARSGIFVIEIQRPESMNALNSELIEELTEIIAEVETSSDVKTLVITGGKNFAAGADISEMVDLDKEGAYDFTFGKVYDRIENLDIPTIAAISGYALGGGLELALCCDIRIASKNAMMGFPEITVGIFPGGGGTVRLPQIIGEGRAKEMIFFGKPMTAEEAKLIGLVNMVTEESELIAFTMKMAEKLANGPGIALKNAKKSVRGCSAIRESNLHYERELWSQLFTTKDQGEGMDAFLSKRKPIYQGK